ncbi:hypothetical protein C8J57DRAFT_1588637 [Mycena rebaudengoi]|nr:hypothetical protein C8J57DRAFT_1588637 [Mycena rebaudengoi]
MHRVTPPHLLSDRYHNDAPPELLSFIDASAPAFIARLASDVAIPSIWRAPAPACRDRDCALARPQSFCYASASVRLRGFPPFLPFGVGAPTVSVWRPYGGLHPWRRHGARPVRSFLPSFRGALYVTLLRRPSVGVRRRRDCVVFTNTKYKKTDPCLKIPGIEIKTMERRRIGVVRWQPRIGPRGWRAQAVARCVVADSGVWQCEDTEMRIRRRVLTIHHRVFAPRLSHPTRLPSASPSIYCLFP